MNIYKCIKVIIGFFLLNIIKADEIDYFWSGAVTSERAVISFASGNKLKLRFNIVRVKILKKINDIQRQYQPMKNLIILQKYS